jgi:tellurite resistance protein TehA-like permease
LACPIEGRIAYPLHPRCGARRVGFTVFFWAAAAWWIPFLAALMAWRYLVLRNPVRYEPQIWGMVFPLGMYTAATFEFSHALGLPFLEPVARVFVVAALTAWTLAFGGLVLELCRMAAHAREGRAPAP